ncbi:hypothetical protein EDB89DRAFT_1906739 [Lactarius sanguifluus]|nr:hypothetical protein EDB89DRAFT_1906739 [Lactarius sanguifluus]
MVPGFSKLEKVSETLEGERGFCPAMNTRVVDEIVNGGGGVISTDLSISWLIVRDSRNEIKGVSRNARGNTVGQKGGVGANNVLKEIALIMGKNLSFESKTKVSVSSDDTSVEKVLNLERYQGIRIPRSDDVAEGGEGVAQAFPEVVPYSTEGEGREVGMGGGVDDAREESVEVRRRDAEGCDGGEYTRVEDDAGGPGNMLEVFLERVRGETPRLSFFRIDGDVLVGVLIWTVHTGGGTKEGGGEDVLLVRRRGKGALLGDSVVIDGGVRSWDTRGSGSVRGRWDTRGGTHRARGGSRFGRRVWIDELRSGGMWGGADSYLCPDIKLGVVLLPVLKRGGGTCDGGGETREGGAADVCEDVLVLDTGGGRALLKFLNKGGGGSEGSERGSGETGGEDRREDLRGRHDGGLKTGGGGELERARRRLTGSTTELADLQGVVALTEGALCVKRKKRQSGEDVTSGQSEGLAGLGPPMGAAEYCRMEHSRDI